VHLTWLAVRRYGIPAAIALVSDGIRQTARYAGAPQKYHVPVSRAWVEIIGHHADRSDKDFTAFTARCPAVLDKRLLTRHYAPATLASQRALRLGRARPGPVSLVSAQPVPAALTAAACRGFPETARPSAAVPRLRRTLCQGLDDRQMPAQRRE